MNKDLSNLKIALVIDWLTGIGGAERVVLELHKMFPKAPIYTSQYNPKKIDWFKNADVRTTWLQKLPSNLKKFMPVLRAYAFSHLDLSEYDLVISITGAEAKAVKTGKDTIHICYLNSPIQYYWMRYDEYIKDPGFGKLDWLGKIGLRIFVGPMRKWDYRAAQRPDYIIANSSYDQSNIKKYYNRDSVIIHPPVEINRFKINTKQKRNGFVIAGRQTPYKKIDLAVKACTKLGLDLKVIGNGPEHDRLVELAGSTVSFFTNVGDGEIPEFFSSAEAFIFPGVDDFGIVAVEALAAGTPVIAYHKGGVVDYINSDNGVFFDAQTTASLSQALKSFQSKKFNNGSIAKTALPFTTKKFSERIYSFLGSLK